MPVGEVIKTVVTGVSIAASVTAKAVANGIKGK